MFQLSGLPDDDPDRQDKFDAVAKAMPWFGGKSVEFRFGGTTLTWPGGTANSNVKSVDHGLSRVPAVVLATPVDSGPFRFSKLAITGTTATAFTIDAQTGDLSSPVFNTQIGVAWIAIG